MYRKLAKMMPTSAKFHQKSIPNRPKVCPGTLPKQSRKQMDFRTLPGGARKGAYNGPWAPIGRFWGPFWTQLGAKGVPKSSILAPSRQKVEKNEFQEKVLKTHEKIIDT